MKTMYRVDDYIMWRSFKVIDRWGEGRIYKIVIKKRVTEYHIKTNLGGIHSEIVRYIEDIKPINK